MIILKCIFIQILCWNFGNHFTVVGTSVDVNEKGCSEPGHGPNSLVTIISRNGTILEEAQPQGYPVGSQAEYVCSKSYGMIGHYQRTCLEDGTWKNRRPICGTNVAVNTIVTAPGHSFEIENLHNIVDSQHTTCSRLDLAKEKGVRSVLLHQHHNISVVRVISRTTNQHSLRNFQITVSVSVPTSEDESTFQHFPIDYTRRYNSVENNGSFIFQMFEFITMNPILVSKIAVRIELLAKCEPTDKQKEAEEEVDDDDDDDADDGCTTVFHLCELAVFSETAPTDLSCMIKENDNTFYGLYKQWCYVIRGKTIDFDWNDAKDSCPETYSLAVHIESQVPFYLNHFMSKISDIPVGTRLWIGGIQLSSKEPFKWLDGHDIQLSSLELRKGTYWPQCVQYVRGRQKLQNAYCDDRANKFICERVISECGIPEQKPGTFLSVNKTSFESLVNYSCPSGHVLVNGTEWRQCLNIGLWSGDAPSCQYVDCGPMKFSHGHVNLLNDHTHYGSWVSLTCDPGFVLRNGSQFSRCEKDGNWSSNHGQCSFIKSGCKWMTEDEVDDQITKEILMNVFAITMSVEVVVLVCSGIMFFMLKKGYIGKNV